MEVADDVHQGTRVRLPHEEGKDYLVRGGTLEFTRALTFEGRLGARKWTSMFLGINGSYGKDDAVDVVYTVGGQRKVAPKLKIET
jgi:hypothetical protein